MKPNLKRFTKITAWILASIGLITLCLAGKSLYDYVSRSEEVKILSEIYDGKDSPLGLIVRQATRGSGGGGVQLSNYLVQMLAMQPLKDEKQRLVVTASRELRPDIVEKIENHNINLSNPVLRVADLITVVDSVWNLSVFLQERDGPSWKVIARSEEAYRQVGGDAPKVDFINFSDATPSVRILGTTNSELVVFTLVGDTMAPLMRFATAMDDLDECLAWRKEHPESAPTTSLAALEKPAGATSMPDSNDKVSAKDESDKSPEEVDMEVDELPDYQCAKITKWSMKLLPTLTSGFHDIEVSFEGQGPERVQKSKTYLGHFSKRSKTYEFGSTALPGQLIDIQTDFIGVQLNPGR